MNTILQRCLCNHLNLGSWGESSLRVEEVSEKRREEAEFRGGGGRCEASAEAEGARQTERDRHWFCLVLLFKDFSSTLTPTHSQEVFTLRLIMEETRKQPCTQDNKAFHSETYCNYIHKVKRQKTNCILLMDVLDFDEQYWCQLQLNLNVNTLCLVYVCSVIYCVLCQPSFFPRMLPHCEQSCGQTRTDRFSSAGSCR